MTYLKGSGKVRRTVEPCRLRSIDRLPFGFDLSRVPSKRIGLGRSGQTRRPAGLSHCPPPNTFNLTNAPASNANTSLVTNIRTIVNPAVFVASLKASSRLRSSLMYRSALRLTPSSPHLLHFPGDRIDRCIPGFLNEVEDPTHDQTTADDQAAHLRAQDPCSFRKARPLRCGRSQAGV